MSEVPELRLERSRKGARRAADIIESGAELLLAEGFAAVNKRRIASRLGISDGNVSYYFSNREALWNAVVDYELDTYYARHHGWLADCTLAPQARFDEFVQRWMDEYRDRMVRVFFSQVLTLAEVEPALARRRDEIYEAFLEQTRDLARPLVPQLDARELERRALLIMALLEGLHAVSAFRPDALLPRQPLRARVLAQVNAVLRGEPAA